MENLKQIVVLQISKKHKIFNIILGLIFLCVLFPSYLSIKSENKFLYQTIALFLIIYCFYFIANSFFKKITITEEFIEDKNLFYSKKIRFDSINGVTKYENYGLLVKKRFGNIKISHEYDLAKRIIAIDYILSKVPNFI